MPLTYSQSLEYRTMAPLIPAPQVRSLPIELIQYIIHDAWFSLLDEGWSDRWEFYRALSLVSRTWRDIMASTALRCVMIQTPQDFQVYRQLVKRRWGVVESKDGERAAPAAREYFERSELHIVVSDWTCPSSTGFYFTTDYARIPCYITACKHISVIVKELPSNDRYSTLR